MLACSEFVSHQFQPNVCRNCYQQQKDHQFQIDPEDYQVSQSTSVTGVITTPSCSKFEPHKFRPDLCINCFHKLEDHEFQTDSPIDESNALNEGQHDTNQEPHESIITTPSCSKFEPHKFRPDLCINCFHKLEDHEFQTDSPIDESNALNEGQHDTNQEPHESIITTPSCSKFEPHKFRPDLCINCFHKLEDHEFQTDSPIDESNPVNEGPHNTNQEPHEPSMTQLARIKVFYSAVITTPSYSKFEPQQFRTDLCVNCVHKKKNHEFQPVSEDSSMNESNAVNEGQLDTKQEPHDPTETYVNTSEEHHLDEEKKQAALKTYYDSFPAIDDGINETTPDVKKAEEFTESILNNEPSGNVSERDTVCHVLSQLFGSQNQQCLFYDSAKGINLHDASGNLADISSQDKPFVLKLISSEGLGGTNDPKAEENDTKLAEILNNVIKNNGSHPVIEDIRERLAKAHGIDPKCIVIKNVYAGTFNVVYTVLDLVEDVVEKVTKIAEKLKIQFAQFVSAKIHPLLYRPSFDISLFDARGNKTFASQSETHQVGPPGKVKPYTTPAGWTRYGLKVLGKYENDNWLHPFGHQGNWYRAFHGTGRAQNVDFSGSNAYSEQQYASVDAAASIFTSEFRKARVHAYGDGVYCSPNPKFPEGGYVNTVELNTKQGKKKFKCMLQVAVNPNGVQFTTDADIWVVPNSRDIRPYGILIKEA